jgi:hypothetical protein
MGHCKEGLARSFHGREEDGGVEKLGSIATVLHRRIARNVTPKLVVEGGVLVLRIYLQLARKLSATSLLAHPSVALRMLTARSVLEYVRFLLASDGYPTRFTTGVLSSIHHSLSYVQAANPQLLLEENQTHKRQPDRHETHTSHSQRPKEECEGGEGEHRR